ncbi:DUF4832 domain-containing protein [Flavihumibacter fluvii]|uniref:DUF4832 domain-containing protein n=1 Tax=Flavihumibacter fluvii TaxID=2838157 RepID=UPI001BDE4E68|nr:DUF4832 domain-containing protein [Flavihumibacter fluvii]ULQ54583.1 DUF4832 domain-containing protein [Flavihumibacter fluvii]
MKKVTVIRLLTCLLFSIPLMAASQTKKITYKETDADFANPERGFYVPSQTTTSKFTALDADRLTAYRTKLQKHGKASYSIYATLLFRYYILDQFTDKALSEDLLLALDEDFNAVRKSGLKMIIRFSYINKVHSDGCADKEGICPPYGDAPKAIVLQHITQLKPLLQKHADVIAVAQQGFIGIWGENYYTDYFGDASKNGTGRILDSNWRDRNEVLKALLDALPKDRMVQVRTPQMKQKYVYGPSATTGSRAMTTANALNGSDAARIGFHNDCFLASIDDYGTYQDYGSTDSPQQPANEIMRSYLQEESRYVPVGGETCDDTFSPQNDCAPAGHAEEEMAAMHFSYLNTSYNNTVNNDWDSMGCMNSIRKKLGYRIVVQAATMPTTGKAGMAFQFSINLVNKGYAAPFNPRTVELVLRNTSTLKNYRIPCKVDVRSWFTGAIEWKENILLPETLPAGRYELLLNLPDQYASISGRPEYSIRLANEGVWEESSGYNKLNHTITIK